MEASRQLSLPIVYEVIEIREIDPKDDFGYPQLAGEVGLEPTTSALTEQRTTNCPTLQRVLFHYKLGWHNNEVEWLDVANKIETPQGGLRCQPDYTRQLQFHEYELSQAEKRHMPPAQVAYHFNRLCLLRKMGVSYE